MTVRLNKGDKGVRRDELQFSVKAREISGLNQMNVVQG
jgi:hypothetical protein